MRFTVWKDGPKAGPQGTQGWGPARCPRGHSGQSNWAQMGHSWLHLRLSLSGHSGGTHGTTRVSAHDLLIPTQPLPVNKMHIPGILSLSRILHIAHVKTSLQADQGPVTQHSCSYTGLQGCQLTEIPGEASSCPGPTAPKSRLCSPPALLSHPSTCQGHWRV